MKSYDVIYEQADDGSWSASVTDLPVFAAGETREDAEREIRSAVIFYLDHLRDAGAPIPEPRSVVGTITV